MTVWQWVIGLVLVLHGIGQLLGVLALTRLGTETWNARSWLLTRPLGEPVARAVDAVLWTVACVLFVTAGLSVLGLALTGVDWRALAVAGALVSLVGSALFWNAFPVLIPNKVGSIAVNLATVWGVLVADWPTDSMLTN
jgi:UPF0716 family protein affecting phage T7 exclusion